MKERAGEGNAGSRGYGESVEFRQMLPPADRLQHRGKISFQWRPYREALPRKRVCEMQCSAGQKQAVRPEALGEQPVMLAFAVGRIADDGM